MPGGGNTETTNNVPAGARSGKLKSKAVCSVVKPVNGGIEGQNYDNQRRRIAAGGE